MLYCQISDNLINSPQPLPLAYDNISNFSALTDHSLKEYGWYPYLESDAPSYDPMTQRLSKSYTISSGVVRDLWQIVPLSPEDQSNLIQQKIQSLGQSVNQHLDSVAKSKDYDSIISACTYASSSISLYRAEGEKCVAWRDAVWVKVYDVLSEVQSGSRPIPSAEQLISELPEMQW